jgi:CubicO group peptidase (beta-lactamase class C family)
MIRPLPAALVLAVLIGGAAIAGEAGTLPRSAPERQGISSAAVLGLIETLDRDVDGMHGIVLLRHGHVVAEGWWRPYDAETPHILFSLSKSFTATAVGIAIAEGKLSLDDEVLKAFADEAPAEPSANLKNMRLRDLLRMNTGHEKEISFWKDGSGENGETWTKRFLAHPVPFKPGTRFLYNTPATFMAGAMVHKATGQDILDYLKPRLFDPIGFKNPTWVKNPQGLSVAGYGLMGRTEDIARFGQLLLQRGQWNGRQLVPAAWIDEATSLRTSNGSNPNSDWDQGYGYQFWRCRHGAYRGDGAFGQYCIVMPEQDAVIAITGGLGNMQAVLNHIWDRLLPAMQQEALAENADAARALTTRLGALTMRLPVGKDTSPLAETVSGTWYAVPENERGITALALDARSRPPALLVRTAAGETRTPVPFGTWSAPAPGFANNLDKSLSVPANPTVSASGAWTADDTFTIKLVLNQTTFSSALNLKFEGQKLTFGSKHNVNFGPTAMPELVGQATPAK